MQAHVTRATPEEKLELTEDDLMLTSPIVYGFSLADKLWREHLYLEQIVLFSDI